MAFLLGILAGCGLGSTNYEPTEADFSGQVFNAAFPDGSPVLSELQGEDLANSSCQFVFNVNTTGTVVFRTKTRQNAPSFVWRVQGDSLYIRLQDVDNRFAVKKTGADYELFNRKIRFVLYKPKS